MPSDTGDSKRPQRGSRQPTEERQGDDAQENELPHEPGDSDPESEVTDVEYEDEVYTVDAIKYAVYKDSRRQRPDGYVGWHYGVMWGGYLKIGSETEEPRESFIVDDEKEDVPFVTDFWKGCGRRIPKSRKEPGGRQGEVVEAPPKLLKRWFRRSNPPRDYATYVRRRAKELAGEPIQKRDSDYYVHKKRLKRREEQRALEAANGGGNLNGFGQVNAEAGPSGARHDNPGGADPAAGSSAPPKRRTRSPSVALSEVSSNYSLFSDSETDDDEEELALAAQKRQKSNKRQRVIDSPDRSPVKTKKFKKNSDLKIKEPKESKKRSREEKKAAKEEKRLKKEKKRKREEREARQKEQAESLSKLGKIRKRDDTSFPSTSLPAPLPPAPQVPTPPASVSPPPVAAAAPVASSPDARRDERPSSSTPAQITSVFGIPDTFIFPTTASAPSGTTAEGTTDSPAASQTPAGEQLAPRRVQEPLFDFGDTPMSQVSIPAEGPEIHEVPDSPKAVGSPSAPEPLPQQSAPEEMPSSTPVNQVAGNAPSLMVTEATPRKNVDEPEREPEREPQREASVDDLFGSSPPPSSPPQPEPSKVATSSSPSKPAQAATTKTTVPPTGSSPTVATGESRSLPTASTSNNPAGLPAKPKPKYVQPRAIKTIDIPLDPQRHKRLAPGLPPPVVTAPLPSSGPSNAASSKSPVQRTQEILSPVQRAQEMLQGDAARRQQGALPQQGELWKNQIQQKPQQPPNWTASAGRPPPPMRGGKSPTYGGRSPGGRSPGGRSPIHGSVSINGLPQRPGFTSPLPQQSTSHPYRPPPQRPPVPSTHYEERRDPRKRARDTANGAAGTASGPAPTTSGELRNSNAAGTTGVSSHGPSSVIPGISSGGPSSNANVFRATIMGRPNVDMDFILKDGDAKSDTFRLKSFLPSSGPPHFELLETSYLAVALAQGAEVIEWSQVTFRDSAKQSNWEGLYGHLKHGYMFLSREELPPTDQPITAHVFAILIKASNAWLGSLSLNGWEMDNIGVMAILLSVPLDGQPVAMLPNPIRPDFANGDQPQQPAPAADRPTTLTTSYNFGDNTAEPLKNTTAVIYPHLNYGTYTQLVDQFKKSMIQPPVNGEPDSCFILNGYWHHTTRSSSVNRYITRRTRLYALGPDLSLPSPQWRMKEVWKTGGLVTFSPTFILHSPDKFADIMDLIRVTPGWAAYIVPMTLVWCEQSWEHRARCPEPTKAFATLTSSLFMDDNLRQLAGAKAADSGGLSVSYCPPLLQQREACAKYVDWLRRVYECGDYESLLQLCKQTVIEQSAAKRRNSLMERRPSSSGNNTPNPGTNSPTKDVENLPEPDLDLITVQSEGIRDLAGMRQRPHVVPYRRYIYIGELSNREEAKQLAEGIVELVPADDFVAVLSGAV